MSSPSSKIHDFLPIFNRDGEVYVDLFGDVNSTPKSQIFDINDLNQGAITNAIEWHFGVKRNAVESLNIRNATGVFLDIWGDVFGIKRPKGMIDEIYKDYILKSIFDFNPTVVGLDELSKKYGFGWRIYDEMGVYTDRAFLDVGVTNLLEPTYLYSSVIIDESIKRSYFLSADSISVFSNDFLEEIQVEKPSGIELYLAETSVFKYLSFPETFQEAISKAENGIANYSISYVEYDVNDFSGFLEYKEVTFHGIKITTPYGVFESGITSLNIDKYFDLFKKGELNLFYIVLRRTNEKFQSKESYICNLEFYPISSYEILEFKYPTTMFALNNDENIASLFQIMYLKDISNRLLYNVTAIVKSHRKKVFDEVPIQVEVTWKYNFNELDRYFNPKVPFFDITAPIQHNARPSQIQNRFFNDGSIVIQKIEIMMKEDGVHVSKETTLDLNIFEANKYSNSKGILGTAIAGVILLKRTNWIYKEEYQMELEVIPVIKYSDGSTSTPLNGSVSSDREKYRIGTFDKQFIDFVYYPDTNSEIVFNESFGTFPNYITESREGYSISKITINAPGI